MKAPETTNQSEKLDTDGAENKEATPDNTQPEESNEKATPSSKGKHLHLYNQGVNSLVQLYASLISSAPEILWMK